MRKATIIDDEEEAILTEERIDSERMLSRHVRVIGGESCVDGEGRRRVDGSSTLYLIFFWTASEIPIRSIVKGEADVAVFTELSFEDVLSLRQSSLRYGRRRIEAVGGSDMGPLCDSAGISELRLFLRSWLRLKIERIGKVESGVNRLLMVLTCLQLLC